MKSRLSTKRREGDDESAETETSERKARRRQLTKASHTTPRQKRAPRAPLDPSCAICSGLNASQKRNPYGLLAQARTMRTRDASKPRGRGEERREHTKLPHRPGERGSHQDVERREPVVEGMSAVLVAAAPKETQKRYPPPTRLGLFQILGRRTVYCEGEIGAGGGEGEGGGSIEGGKGGEVEGLEKATSGYAIDLITKIRRHRIQVL